MLQLANPLQFFKESRLSMNNQTKKATPCIKDQENYQEEKNQSIQSWLSMNNQTTDFLSM